MNRVTLTFLIAGIHFSGFSDLAYSQTTAVPQQVGNAVELPPTTEIDDYVRRPDDSFRWEVVSATDEDDMQVIVLDMTSQKWRSADEVNRTQWKHWITCAVPKNLRSEIAFMMIGGGSNRGGPPKGPDSTVKRIAEVTGSVVFELKMIPNQPLIFHDDGKERVEDDLIGYTWDQYLKTGDSEWLARNPMVKSAVRAMDAVSEMMASEIGGARTVNKFVVAGGSKRGWTTWLTGAMDDRVIAIIPVVIDVLNADASMRHHFAAYGYWAPAIGNYVQHRIMERIDHPRLRAAYRLVDPYYYRHRLTLPKFIVNAAGDQFFLPDSSKFYFDDLEGPKYLRYVPNADHGLDGSDAIESVSAFYALQVANQPPPQFTWTNDDDGAFRVVSKTRPKSVKLWHATNPDARDFRMETLGPAYKSKEIESQDGKTFVANVAKPEQGWTAYFVELTFDVGLPVPLKMTTNVRVIPDVLPYADKSPDLPFSLTVVCESPSPEDAKKAVAELKRLVESRKIQANELRTKIAGARCYFNWRPSHDRSRKESEAMTVALTKLGCRHITYQLESGSGITP